MTPKEKIKEIKAEETARFNYTGNLTIKTSTHPCFSGCMDLLTTARIEIGYNPRFEEEAKDLEKIVNDPFTQAAAALIRHELNHKGGGDFQGCPQTLELHVEEILEPVAQTLKQQDVPNVQVSAQQTLYAYMANLVEDIIDNTELGNKTDHVGMFVMYKDDAQHAEEPTFTPLFDAFVQLQQKLFGGKRAQKLLKGHTTDNPEVQKAIDNVMQRTGLNNYTREVTSRRKKKTRQVFDKKRATRHLTNKSNWKQFATIVAEEFSKLLDKDKLQQPDYIKEMFIPLKGEADTFADEMDNKETKMRFVEKRYKEQGTAFSPPAFLENFDALDVLYQKLARNLEIKTRSATSTTTMPIMQYGQRPFDAKTDKLSKARVSMKTGKMQLVVPRFSEQHPIEYTEPARSLPKIKLVLLDTSGSMKTSVNGKQGKVMNPWADESVQWTDTSRYHHALVGWYGLQELLRKKGALKHTSVHFANYSNETKTATTLKASRRLALTPQFGYTSLDMDTVDDMFGRGELVLSLSDGDMDNWSDIKEEYIQRAQKSEYVHIQIGGQTTMTQDLEAAGVPVVYDDGSNLGKLVLDVTRPMINRRNKR